MPESKPMGRLLWEDSVIKAARRFADAHRRVEEVQGQEKAEAILAELAARDELVVLFASPKDEDA